MKTIIKFEKKSIPTIEERTALSVLMGLRIKFTKEANKNPQKYSSDELARLINEVMKNMNKQRIKDFGRKAELEGRYTDWEDEIWGIIGDSIKKSKILRFPWNDILGMSLTKAIHICRNNGKDVNETYKELATNENVKEFIEKNKRRENKILENLEISVHARYGENNTAEKMKSSPLNN